MCLPACLLAWARGFSRDSGPVIWSIGQDWRWEAFFAYDCPARCARRIRLVAYGARLESVLGASPRGFESPILRHRTPEPAQVPGFSLRLQRKVPIVGGALLQRIRVFPLVVELEGKNRGTKYEISTTRRGGRWGAFLLLLLVAPLDLRPPRGLPRRAGLLGVPVGGGPPASRPRCEPSARRVASKPGQAPQASRRPPIGRGLLLRVARPRRRPRAPQPGPASRSSAVPSGALHTGGACRAVSTAARP